MDRRRFLLTVGANKWLTYPFEFLYHSLIPTQINGSKVQDKAKLTKIYGNGVIENQLIDFENQTFVSDEQSKLSLTKDDSNKTLTLTCTNAISQNAKINTNIPVIKNHKVLFIYDLLSSISFTLGTDNNTFQGGIYLFGTSTSVVANQKMRVSQAYTCDGNITATTWRIGRGSTSWSVGNTMIFSNIQYIDLTLMFGTGNEPTTITDNRIQALLNRGYITYNTGSYKNSRVGEIECEPYNLLNLDRTEGTGGDWANTTQRVFEEGKYYPGMTINNYCSPVQISNLTVSNNSVSFQTGSAAYGVGFPIRVISGKSYKLEYTSNETGESGTRYYGWYDKNGNNIGYDSGSGSKTAPQDAYWCLVVLRPSSSNDLVTYSNICLHLQGTRTGYAPYQAPTKITLNGLLELNGAINSHDTFEITNTDYVFTRNIGVVDLGDSVESYYYPASQSNKRSEVLFQTTINTSCKNESYSTVANALCNNYSIVKADTTYTYQEKSLSLNKYNNTSSTLMDIYVCDSSFVGMTAAQMKAALTGTKLYYELATPQVITIPKKHLGCVDLGSLNWHYQNDWQGSKKRFFAYFNKMKDLTDSTLVGHIFTKKYTTVSNTDFYVNDKNFTIAQVGGGNDGYIELRDDDYTSASAFKSAMAGVYLFYETDAEVSDFDNIAQINAGGSINANEFSANFEQVIENGDFTDTSAWSFFSGDSDNTFTVSGNVGVLKMYSYGDTTIFRQQYTPVSGHKYLLVADYRVTTLTQSFSWVLGSNTIDLLFASTTYQRLVNIGTRTDANPTFGISLSVTRSIDFRLRNVKYIDLTETFGAGNEPTSENDYRVQYILNGGSLDAVAETEVLPNVNFKIKCK